MILDGSLSNDSDGTIVSYEWYEGALLFGESSLSTLPFDFSLGAHTITLTVVDDDGASASDTVLIEVTANQAPVADAGPDQSASTGTGVLFDGSNSVDADGFLVDYNWDFGDGSATTSGVSVSHTYAAVGTYVVTLTVVDNGGLVGEDTATIIVDDISSFSVRVANSTDDAEERASGSVCLTSSDLELVFDGGGNQTVGLRFNGVDIPQGAPITNAYIQFQVDETPSDATSVIIEGENVDNAATFTSSNGNISSRPRTTAAVSWSPVPWTTVGEAGPDQRTLNIASVIQDIVNRPGGRAATPW